MALVSIAEATEYFSGHLYAGVWSAADNTKRLAALTHAERDIKTLNYPRGRGGPSNADLRAAICEQALFLLGRTTADLERIRAQRAGVKFRWVGDAREDYTGGPAVIAPEALRILSRFVRLRTGSIR